MRKGINPSKTDNRIYLQSTHRIILSVFIPNLEDDYFKHAREIFQLCLESVLFTVHDKTRISIIINGCCTEVEQLIFSYKEAYPLIDQVFYTRENLGKINAIYSIIKSNLEPLITISDSDVLFLEGWQKETYEVFRNFPQAGMVSPVPSSKGFLFSTASTLYFGLFKGNIRFRDVQDPDGMDNFQRSVGSKLYDPIHLKKYLVIANNGKEAVIGCGHFVGTFRKEVFEYSPTKVCEFRVQGGSEEAYLDDPNDHSGFLRLATLGNFAYHLGNTPAAWMHEKLLEIKSSLKKSSDSGSIPPAQPLPKMAVKIGQFLWVNLFYRFRKQFFGFLGMNEKY
ncbi:MAG TPA: glycosyltransferase family A protein [Algoriphagus sp.]|nr:glycosyltransferase family A protein [Algoriphagus sp.]